MRSIVPVLLCIPLVVHAAQLTWAKIDAATSTVPSAREHAALGFDRTRNRLVVFGGSSALGDTWVFDLSTNTWSEVLTSPAPPGRRSMVYGSSQTLDAFFVAAGQSGSTMFNDVWKLDLGTLTWSQVQTTGVGPSGRYGASGGIDPFDPQYLIVSHGFDKSERYEDTFALNLRNMTWTEVTPDNSPVPFARCLQGGTVVDTRTLVIQGGCGSGGHGPCPAYDAWSFTAAPPLSPSSTATTFDPRPGLWTAVSSCPRPRIFPTMARMPGARQRVLLFGGDGGLYGEDESGAVGVLDLPTGRWDLVTAAGAAKPSVRRGSAAIMMPAGAAPSASDVVYIFGGNSGGNEVWRLSGDELSGLPTQSCSDPFNLRVLHGVLMMLSWGVLLPIGVTIARFGRFANPLWFKLHRTIQSVGLLLALAGFVVAMLINQVAKFLAMPHAILGVVITVLGLQQPLNAFFRPHPPSNRTKSRICWELWHKNSGRVAVVLGLLNPFWGLSYLGVTSFSFILYSTWVGALALFWLGMTLAGFPGSENPSPVAAFFKRHSKACASKDSGSRDAVAHQEMAPTPVGNDAARRAEVKLDG